MRTETFPAGQDVFARFPGARACGRAEGAVTYLAERAGTPYLIILPAEGPATVIAFDDEAERARHLAGAGAREAVAG